MDRRRFLKTTGLTLAARHRGSFRPFVARAQAAPIRIGLMAPQTGVVAPAPRDHRRLLAVLGERRQPGGRPQGGDHRRRRRLQSGHGAAEGATPRRAGQGGHALRQSSANTGLAVANYVKGNGTPYFIPVIAADDLTQRARIMNVIRAGGYSASQFSRPLADWALKQGYRKVAMILPGLPRSAMSSAAASAQAFTEGGGTVVGQFGIR